MGLLPDMQEPNGPLLRNVTLWVTHAPGMPRTSFSPLGVSDSDTHRGTWVIHVPWGMPASLTSGFLWSRWREKCSRHSRCMRNPQCYVYGKRPIRFSSAHNPKFHLVIKAQWGHEMTTIKSNGIMVAYIYIYFLLISILSFDKRLS